MILARPWTRLAVAARAAEGLGFAAILAAVALASGCGGRDARGAKSPATLAAEAKAGDFSDYWAEVLRLSRRHAAHPDSFRTALDALPGTHLSDEEWEAWVAPYRARPGALAAKLERTMTEVLSTPPKAAKPESPRSREAAPAPPAEATPRPSTSRSESP